MYLWRAVDQNNEVLDIMLSQKRDTRAAVKFLKQLLKQYGHPHVLITDRHGSYTAAIRELKIETSHHRARWQNNRAELSHQPTRQKERQCRKFKDPTLAEKFLHIHAAIYNHFNTRRHQTSAAQNRELRSNAFTLWKNATRLAA